jgi:SAM-dependent methyltransferase
MTFSRLFQPGNRANPKIFDKDYLFLRTLTKELKCALTGINDENLSILDVGSTNRPYFSLFKGKHRRYLSLDIERPKVKPGIVGEAQYLPIASSSVDVCLCTQVLEHVEDPTKVVSELARVLKEGGILLLSTHGVFHYHPYPHDYWRWTAEGLDKIIREYFPDVTIKPNGGTMLLLFHIIGRGLFFVADRSPFTRALKYTLYPAINALGLIADYLVKDDSLSMNYLAVAIK